MSFPAYESYADCDYEWLGELPSHWEAVPNKAAFLRVKTEVGEEWSNTQLLSLTLRGVVIRDIESGEGKYPSDFSNYQIVEPNDLVFCLFDMDETPRTVGLSQNTGMITGAYDVFRCQKGMLPSYAYYFYRHIDSYKRLRPFYSGLRKTVRTPTFLSIKMPRPPLDEQKAIASFLDSETSKIDALVSEQRRLIELLKEKRQAVISHAVTKGLNPNAPMKDSGIEWVGEIPQHWGTPPVFARYYAVLGKMLDEAKLTGEHPIQYLRNADVNWDSINCEALPIFDIDPDEYERFTLKPGDILICEGGAGIGQTAIWQGELERCAYQKALHRLRPWNADRENPRFFYYCMRYIVETGVVLAGGTATIPHLTGEQLRKYRFPRPLKDEQDEIIEFLNEKVSRFGALEAESERAIELLHERRTALISAAVTGKIDVRDIAVQNSFAVEVAK